MEAKLPQWRNIGNFRQLTILLKFKVLGIYTALQLKLSVRIIQTFVVTFQN